MNPLARIDLWLTGNLRTLMLPLFVIAAGVSAVLSGAEPTGLSQWDDVLNFAGAAVIVVGAWKAPDWAVITACIIGAASAGITFWGLVGWSAMGLSLIAGFLADPVAAEAKSIERRPSLEVFMLGAAALAVTVLYRLPAAGWFGLQTMLGCAAGLLVVITGYQHASRTIQRVASWFGGAVLIAAAVVALAGGAALVTARDEVNTGIDAAERGLVAARGGDAAIVPVELKLAESAFISAADTFDSLSVRALQFLPIAAQHQRSLQVAVEQGAVVARQAAATVKDADISAMRLSAGSVDLTVLQRMAPQLRETERTLLAASSSIESARSPWLVPVVQERIDDLLFRIDDLVPEAVLAADAAEVLPGMLGLDTPQTYFVMFGTPAESRELGGFLGSWAVVSFDGGKFAIDDAGRINELFNVARASTLAPDDTTDWFLEMANPTEFPQNLPSSPDFRRVADVSRQVLAGAVSGSIDGFIYIDAIALIDVLELTGPVNVGAGKEPLTAENAPALFFEDQYRLEESSRTEVFDELAAVAPAVLARLGSQTRVGAEDVGRVLGPAARGGHLQVVTFDDRQNDFLRSIKLLRDFDRGEAGDFVGLVQTNGLSNKMDLYLERTLAYDVTVDDDGLLTATATATLVSTVPADAPELTLGRGEDRGRNRVLLSLYSPHALQDLRVDGQIASVTSIVEFGLARYLVEVFVPPTGQPVLVEFELEGRIVEPYSVRVWHQPLVNTDQVLVTYRSPSGSLDWSGELVETVDLTSAEVSYD